MKSSLFFIGLILLSFLACENSKPEDKKVKVPEIARNKSLCEQARKEAESDYEKGELGLYFYGLSTPRFDQWIRLMKETYQLKVKGGGDIVDEKGDCYNEVMMQKIKEKYGEQALDRIENKLDSLYAIGLGDRRAEFVGGQSELMKYVYCNIADSLLVDGADVPIMIIQVQIQKSGVVQKEKILFSNAFIKEKGLREAKAIDLIEKMPDWIPGIENGKKVDYLYNIPIKFSREMKSKYCG